MRWLADKWRSLGAHLRHLPNDHGRRGVLRGHGLLAIEGAIYGTNLPGAFLRQFLLLAVYLLTLDDGRVEAGAPD